MEIIIPKEYCNNFEKKAYLTFCGNNSVLLMNKEEKERYEDILNISKENIKKGIIRFFKANIIEVNFDNEVVYIPNRISELLRERDRVFRKKEIGLVIC